MGCEESGEVREALAATGWWDEVWSADLLPSGKPPLGTFWADGTRIVTAEGEREGRGYHYIGDVRDLFRWDHPVNEQRKEFAWSDVHGYEPLWAPLWDLAVLHPPCDFLTQAGARYWRLNDATRGGNGRMQESAAFFMEMTRAPARYRAVENPRGVMCRDPKPDDPDRQVGYRRPDDVVSPWMFGDPLVKETCLWTWRLPPLEATHSREDYPELFRVATGGGSHRTDWKRTGRSNNGWEDRLGRKNRKRERSRTAPGLAKAMAEQWTKFIMEQEERA